MSANLKTYVRIFALVPMLFVVWANAAIAANTSVAFRQAIAETASNDKGVFAFYKSNEFEPLWIGRDRVAKQRRKALFEALDQADDHGLPRGAYRIDELSNALKRARSDRDLGRLEVTLTQVFLDYARDVQTGILTPKKVDSEIVRKVPLRDRLQVLDAFSKSTPAAFVKSLPPQSAEYTRLMKQKFILERVVNRGGWGPKVPNGKYQLGDSGNGVVALRNRLIAMGYLQRNASPNFDARMQKAVQQFQTAHGLNADGVAGAGTIGAANVSAVRRLGSIITAMERERWNNKPLGERHVWVNIADFSASIIDRGSVTFKTRAVVGSNKKDQRSPEFSDLMEHMVINPSWYVPRSITVKEYLPLLQQDPSAVSHLNLLDGSGRVVSRQGIDFASFTEQDFPFDMKQPPSRGNALGLVKFMFPNRYNIYLHDTPAKSLFARERRAFSHGCIRLAQPFDFAYALLAKQSSNPKELFHSNLARNVEVTLPLKVRVPVHIGYRTAFTDARGNVYFRDDVYGRDGRIFEALVRAGVAIEGLRS